MTMRAVRRKTGNVHEWKRRMIRLRTASSIDLKNQLPRPIGAGYEVSSVSSYAG